MMIDKRFDKSYFEHYIARQNHFIKKYEDIANGRVGSNKQEVYVTLANKYKDLIAAQFSHGDSIADIKSTFEKYVENLDKVDNMSYSDYIDCLSLQVILEVDDLTIRARKDFDDDLAIILKSYIYRNKPVFTNKLLFKDYYAPFFEYATDKKSALDLIEYVNNKWYIRSSGFYWYESHVRMGDIYAGYWCYIASALLKMKKDLDKVSNSDHYIVGKE